MSEQEKTTKDTLRETRAQEVGEKYAMVLVRSICLNRISELIGQMTAKCQAGAMTPKDWDTYLARAKEAQHIGEQIQSVMSAYDWSPLETRTMNELAGWLMSVTFVDVDGNEYSQRRPIDMTEVYVTGDPGARIIGGEFINPEMHRHVPVHGPNERVEHTLGGKCIVYEER